jgi:hypothetical protein
MNTNIASFEQLCEYLKSVRSTWASGVDLLPSNVLAVNDGDSRIVHFGSGSAIFSNNLRINLSYDAEDTADIIEAVVALNCKEAFRFSVDDQTDQNLYLEAPLTPSANDQSRVYLMEKGNERRQELYVDVAELRTELTYRLFTKNKTVIDPGMETISFIGKIGICHADDLEQKYKIHLNLSLNVIGLFEKTDNEKFVSPYYIRCHPDWLVPTQSQFLMNDENGLDLTFNLNSKNICDSKKKDRLKIVSSDNEKSFDLLIKCVPFEPGIWAVPQNKEIKKMAREPWGASIKIDLPFLVYNTGKLKLDINGPGVKIVYTLDSNNPKPHLQTVPVTINTSKISPFLGRNLKLLIRSDAKLVNRRDSEIKIRFELVTLSVFPTNRLDWSDCPSGSRPSRILEFFDGSTNEPVSAVEAKVPGELSQSIDIQSVKNKPHSLKFSLDTTCVAVEAPLQGQILVTGTCHDGLVLHKNLDVKATLSSSQMNINLKVDRETSSSSVPMLIVTIRNTGNSRLQLYTVFWDKDRFRRYVPNDQRGRGETKHVEPGESHKRYYLPIKKAAIFYNRRFTDILTVQTNDLTIPNWRRRVTMTVCSKIGVFRTANQVKMSSVTQ